MLDQTQGGSVGALKTRRLVDSLLFTTTATGDKAAVGALQLDCLSKVSTIRQHGRLNTYLDQTTTTRMCCIIAVAPNAWANNFSTGNTRIRNAKTAVALLGRCLGRTRTMHSTKQRGNTGEADLLHTLRVFVDRKAGRHTDMERNESVNSLHT